MHPCSHGLVFPWRYTSRFAQVCANWFVQSYIISSCTLFVSLKHPFSFRTRLFCYSQHWAIFYWRFPSVKKIELLTLSLLRVINVKFPLQPHQKYYTHTVRRTWLFIAYSGERWLYYKFLLPHLYIFSLRGWENVLFELRSERVNGNFAKLYDQSCGVTLILSRAVLGWS